jgi:glycosyltransferase involved in cell wall biosynthesis
MRATALPPVMILGDHFGYPGGVPHGVTSYFLQVLPALRRAGIDLTVCFLREPHPSAEGLRAHGITPIFFDVSKWDPTVALRIARLARQRDIRLLHSTGLKGTFMARVAARLSGARNILHVHDLNDPGTALSALQRVVARRNDLAVCVSEAVRDLTVNRYHVADDRIRVIHNGIRLEEIQNVGPDMRASVRRTLGIEARRPVLGMIGRMHAVKGHRTLLNTMPQIVASCPDVLLLLVGDGPERSACEELVDRLGVRNSVMFLGSRTDVPQLLTATDLVLMPSHSEGLGLAAIEGLAAGKPVVAFNVGGLREVVSDGVNGRLVRPGDSAAFGQAVVEMIRDPARLAQYSAAALRTADRFSVEEHVRRLIDCYREAAS